MPFSIFLPLNFIITSLKFAVIWKGPNHDSDGSWVCPLIDSKDLTLAYSAKELVLFHTRNLLLTTMF